MDELRVVIFQQAARLGDVAFNVERVAVAARAAGADLFLTPELALTGYDVRDTASSLAISLRGDGLARPLEPLGDVPGTVVTGLIEAGEDGGVFNSAVALRSGRIVHTHRKVYLPTYGMFDEMRYFSRGRSIEPVEIGGWRLGILVCEDFWHPGLIYALASSGIDALLVLAAGAGRGVLEGGEHGDFASTGVWERIARTTAQVYGIYVALSNRVGVEGGVTFAGGSVIVSPTGEVLSRGTSHDEMTLEATFTRRVLHGARRPYYHGRDDDPGLVTRELTRLTAVGRPL